MGFVACINKSWSKDHLINTKTKKTICGLRWKKQVWVPDAIFFSAHNKCKVCFKKRKPPPPQKGGE